MNGSKNKQFMADVWQMIKTARDNKALIGIEYNDDCSCIIVHYCYGDVFIKASSLKDVELVTAILQNIQQIEDWGRLNIKRKAPRWQFPGD